jgi:hypothetical protein
VRRNTKEGSLKNDEHLTNSHITSKAGATGARKEVAKSVEISLRDDFPHPFAFSWFPSRPLERTYVRWPSTHEFFSFECSFFFYFVSIPPRAKGVGGASRRLPSRQITLAWRRYLRSSADVSSIIDVYQVITRVRYQWHVSHNPSTTKLALAATHEKNFLAAWAVRGELRGVNSAAWCMTPRATHFFMCRRWILTRRSSETRLLFRLNPYALDSMKGKVCFEWFLNVLKEEVSHFYGFLMIWDSCYGIHQYIIIEWLFSILFFQ